jgi:lysophospholipase L1-like esterase
MFPRLLPLKIAASLVLYAAAAGALSGAALPPEQFSRPVVAADGTSIFLYRASDGRLFIRKSDAAGVTTEKLLSSLAAGIFSPGLVADRANRLWVFGEDRSAGRSLVFLNRLDDATLADRAEFLQPSGRGRAADVAFDAGNSPWIAWTAKDGGGEKIFCADVEGRKTWTVAAGGGLTVARPRLIAEPCGRLWVVWAGAWRGSRGVFYSVYDGLGWSEAKKAGGRADYPCLDAEPAVDGRGRIWLAWSGYDGQNYGIDYSTWNGRSWAATRRLDGESAGAARAPRLDFLGGSEPLAVWDEAGAQGHQTLASVNHSGAWSKPVAIGTGIAEGDFPKIAILSNRIAVVGLGGRMDGVEILDASRLAAAERPRSRLRPAQPIFKNLPSILFNPLLGESKYIGYGDSITYGVMDYQYAPEKGYIPRLKVLLEQTFGPTDLSNDGIGGETTLYGMNRLDSVLALRQARYLLLLEGTNDVKLLEIPMDTAIFNLKEMLRKCLAAGVFPLISTLLPRRDWIWYFPDYTDRFFELNAAIPLMAAEKGVPLIDFFTIFEDYAAGGADALLSTDLVHPNEKGYQLMAVEWLNAIRAFPFAPVQIQARQDQDKILFYRKPVNMLSWITSPKIADSSIIRNIKIYRRKRGEGVNQFGLIATVSGTSSYFDATITSGTTYEYILASVRMDGIEGPASDLVII